MARFEKTGDQGPGYSQLPVGDSGGRPPGQTMPAPRTILDHIDQIDVPGDVFGMPANEYWALLCLREGLEFLRRQAAKCDELARQQLNPEGKLHVIVPGNDPVLRGIPQALLTCAFHWYAISACQYVRTVGAIAYRLDPTRPLPHDYVKQVIPEVLAFRDKVAAHFAWSTKHGQDSHAERLASILPPLTFVDNAFFVGESTVIARSAGKVSDSSVIGPWSIVGVHHRLLHRYWPESLCSGGKPRQEPS